MEALKNAGKHFFGAALKAWESVVDFEPLESIPYFSQCRVLVNGLGYELINLRLARSRGSARVNAVIAGKAPGQGIGTDDCARVHRPLRARLEALTGMDDFSMEVASPGAERNIKNAAEFALFTGKAARFWDTRVSDWVTGVILGASDTDVTLETDRKPESGAGQTCGAGQTPGAERETVALPFEYIAKAKLLP